MSSDDDLAIRVSAVSKRYEIYDSPRDRLMQMLMRGRRQYFREFWALKDVSFELRRGETVGIIGRNGSGKSTLLQLICGTLNPTTGTVDVRGRIAALLELGAGFNPEFSGRENVFMAAKLHGLTDHQIGERFDSIAAFADIGEFIDQPVKTYSSGMYVRLAFAVNAHVDADILVIDEALAVGDAVFTQKCMRFIRAFQARGTLLFVSHDSSAVQGLCRSAIWLSKGQVRAIGQSKAVCEDYLQYTLQEIYGEEARLHDVGDKDSASRANEDSQAVATTASELQTGVDFAPIEDYGVSVRVRDNLSEANGWKTGGAEIVRVCVETPDGASLGVLKGGETVRMVIRAIAHQRLDRPILGFLVRDRLGQDLFGENTVPFTDRSPMEPVEAGQAFEAHFLFQMPMLLNGSYSVMASVADGDLHENVQHHWLHDALILEVSYSRVRFGLVGVRFQDVVMRKTA